MIRKISHLIGEFGAFVLGCLAVLVLLLLVGGLWWSLPPQPRFQLTTPARFAAARVSPSGRCLMVFSDTPDVLTVLDISTGQVRASIPISLPRGYDRLRAMPDVWMSPDDQLLAYSFPVDRQWQTWDLRMWDLAAQRERFVLSGRKDRTTVLLDGTPLRTFQRLTVLPDGQTLLIDQDTFVDVTTGERRAFPDELAKMLEEGWEIRQTVWPRSLLCRTLPLENSANPFAVWDHEAATLLLPPVPCTTPDVEESRTGLDPTGKLVACVDGAAMDLWDLTTRSKILSIREPGHLMQPHGFSPDGSRLLVGALSGGANPATDLQKMEVWDVASRPPRLGCSLETPLQLDFSADSKWLVSFRDVSIWNMDTFERQPLPEGFDYNPPRFSADSRLLIDWQDAGSLEESRLSDWLPDWLARPRDDRMSLQVMHLATGKRDAPFIVRNALFDVYSTASGAGMVSYDRAPDDTGILDVWDLPPRRPAWVEYGLPAVFVVLLLLGTWHCVRFCRRVKRPAIEAVAIEQASQPIQPIQAD